MIQRHCGKYITKTLWHNENVIHRYWGTEPLGYRDAVLLYRDKDRVNYRQREKGKVS